MGLITETNAQYYAGQQLFTQPNPVVTQVFNWTGDTDLVVALAGVSNANFKVLKNNIELTFTTEYTVIGNSITLVGAGISVPGDVIKIQLLQFAMDANHGSYEYERLNDIINHGKTPVPLSIELQITNTCHQACYYCNSEIFRKHNPDKATTEDWINFIDNLPDGINDVTFSGGGEPLDHLDADKILSLIHI